MTHVFAVANTVLGNNYPTMLDIDLIVFATGNGFAF